MDGDAVYTRRSPVGLEALLLRLLLLHEAVVGCAALPFAEMLQQVQERSGWVFEGARFHLLSPREAQGLPGRGLVEEPRGYGAYFGGPPEPLYLFLEHPGIQDPTELRLAALYMDHLLSMLRAAGCCQELERQAHLDWLTSLGNRRSLERRLQQGLPPNWGLALLDLDNLKEVNDTQGHLAGDRLLSKVGEALRHRGLEAYRIGGDEFVVLLYRPDLECLRQAIQGQSLSLGIAWSEEAEAANLLHLADQRMYADKRRRKAMAPPRTRPLCS